MTTSGHRLLLPSARARRAAAVAPLATWLLGLAAGAAGMEALAAPTPPQEREISRTYDMMNHSLFRPLARQLDPARLARKVASRPREAANVDENDLILLPSAWWQPRLGFQPVTVDQMLRGPGTGLGPAPGRWRVTQAKTGRTRGFQIRDAREDRFIIKLDPAAYAEMTTSADVLGSTLFWAAGYNVPENTIATFRLEDLEIKEDAAFTDHSGRKSPMTRQHLEEVLREVPRHPDGSYRAMASRFLEGKPLGPFEYRGRRKDDPEDLVPHELRRELRGLWTVAAWLNHVDSRAGNTLDMWVTEGDRSFVRHYLIDFGSILGASANSPHAYSTGTEYGLDFNVMLRQLATAGLLPFAWEEVVDPRLPSIGFVEAEVFEAENWRPDYPNPAFDERTLRDIRWGARIVAAFTDDHIRAAIARASYTDPRAADYLFQVLKERRDKIVLAWLPPGRD